MHFFSWQALTKFAGGRHGHPTDGVHPASHRFPVHWTGDSVSLSTTVGDMLDEGVSSFMPVRQTRT